MISLAVERASTIDIPQDISTEVGDVRACNVIDFFRLNFLITHS